MAQAKLFRDIAFCQFKSTTIDEVAGVEIDNLYFEFSV